MAYHRYLVLYKNCSPNIKGGVYALFRDSSDWLKTLSANFQLCIIEEDSYRINEGKAIVNVASYSQLADFFKVSYIQEVFVNETPYISVKKFFHVTNSTWQSGKVYFDVKPDHFANAMCNGAFSNIDVKRITRTSRGTPELRSHNSVLTYDGGAVTRGKLHYSLKYYDYASYQNLCAVAKVDMILENDLFGNNPVTRTAYVAFDVGDIYSKFQAAYSSVGDKQYDGLTMVQDFLGSIYQATTYTGQPNALACRCSGIYILPQGYISPLANRSIDSSFDFTGTLRSALTPYEGTLLGRILPACHYEEELGIIGSTTDISGVRYYGVRGQMIELPRSFLSQECALIFDSNACGMSIKLRVGKDETDFTSAFSLPCSFSNDIDTEETQQINGMKSAVSGISNVLRNLRKVSPLGAALEVGNSLANAMLTSNTKANPIDGNAFMTYLPEQDENETIDEYITKCHTKWASPFITAFVDDDASTSYYIMNYGVVTDIYAEGNGILSTLPRRLALSGLNETSTFVKANVTVTGCTAEERDAIINAFADGMKYIWYGDA